MENVIRFINFGEVVGGDNVCQRNRFKLKTTDHFADLGKMVNKNKKNMKTILKWTWRIVRFPFVMAIWLLGGIIMGIVTPCDWLANPDKWNGLNRKEEKNG